ncbi:flavodoxin domain-containing protein [Maribellus sp. YY47]|uniref:flavodoxin domain-containing protein n=1 Tax=Maribellus sp. YY47 TaxID=2929486 RepID=UPI002000BCF3|nr:flavodoxin domain-containing protein [Maribellus sp. YY47]MCK3683839.1 flavodoxin domain-containing protein [Maribellus sp. YY47]
MKTLITYCTTHGCTETIARELQQLLGQDVVLCNLKKEKAPDLSSFDRIIVGGSIHAGQIQKRIKSFCKQHAADLKEKELGLFICCMDEGEEAQTHLSNAYPEDLLNHAKATACLGGEFNFEKMNFLEKFIVRKVAKIDHSASKMDKQAIRKFSNRMDRIFNPFLFLA